MGTTLRTRGRRYQVQRALSGHGNCGRMDMVNPATTVPRTRAGIENPSPVCGISRARIAERSRPICLAARYDTTACRSSSWRGNAIRMHRCQRTRGAIH